MRIRTDQSANYRAVFFNGKTIRQRLNRNLPISIPKFAEIEDVAINNKCYAACPYCYTNAEKTGINFNNIVDKANLVWGSVDENSRPFQIAIGGAGESTIHPNWIDFVKFVRSLNIVPNYTTNGMHLSDQILVATQDYCGGVALSFHPHIEKVFHIATDRLNGIKTKLNVHIIVGDEKSFNDLKRIFNQYENIFDYFVILPYQAVGRAVAIKTEQIWKETLNWISDVNSEKFAFGALFYEFLQNNNINLNIDIYEPEIYSGYRIFDKSFLKLRKSSYDLTSK